MTKNILFILLIAGSAIGAILLFRQPAATRQFKETAPATQRQTAISSSTQEKNGITVTVAKLTQGNDTTTVSLVLDNHQYNLAEDRIYDDATLNGQTSISHVIPSDAAGGHHVEAEVVFPQTNSGTLVISPVENTTFTFSDLWK